MSDGSACLGGPEINPNSFQFFSVFKARIKISQTVLIGTTLILVNLGPTRNTEAEAVS